MMMEGHPTRLSPEKENPLSLMVSLTEKNEFILSPKKGDEE
jgi:hypothetical protein